MPPPLAFFQGKEQGPTHPDGEREEISHDALLLIIGGMAQWISDLYISSHCYVSKKTET